MSHHLQEQLPSLSANSSGQSLADESQLNNHYRLAKAEYDACIAVVGIQQSWRVLDAGCGNGVFLPHLLQLVGETGSVVALDHAPENLELAQRRIRELGRPSQIDTQLSSVTELPFENGSFDCVWCANVSQYLTDAELDKAIVEFVRVVKPGGLVALKEADIALWQFRPVDPRLIWRLYDAGAMAGDTQLIGALRGWGISQWIRQHGMEVIKQQTTLIERSAPFEPFAIAYLGGLLQWLASRADLLPLTHADKAEWGKIGGSIEAIFHDPNACYQEAFTLTVGRRKKV
ncbi:MAG: class I SAM-dependent methyltransferase [Caldilineaceae bacterium]